MSINQYSSNLEVHQWSQYMTESSSKNAVTFWADGGASGGAMLCNQSAADLSFNLNNEDEEELLEENINNALSTELEHEVPKEALFEKPLTPSDVGKLNRLVIPKQHAEKYFPLSGGGGGGEIKGLLLGFEDELGKAWRFRYSYWNSSQSYVLTKGWSRFVKEKRLDAGDIVVFARHRKEVGRLFIGWRRRNSGGGAQPPPGGGHGYPSQHQAGSSSSVLYRNDDCPHADNNERRSKGGNWKRLRLFGVNLECQEDDDSTAPMDHQYYSNHH